MEVPCLVAWRAVAFVEAETFVDLFAGHCGWCRGHGDEGYVFGVAAVTGTMVGEARFSL